jgi:hypothetical protein
MKRETLIELLAGEIDSPTHIGWDKSCELVTAILDRLDSLGMVVVPREPTGEQEKAAQRYTLKASTPPCGSLNYITGIYRAMLSPSGGGG